MLPLSLVTKTFKTLCVMFIIKLLNISYSHNVTIAELQSIMNSQRVGFSVLYFLGFFLEFICKATNLCSVHFFFIHILKDHVFLKVIPKIERVNISFDQLFWGILCFPFLLLLSVNIQCVHTFLVEFFIHLLHTNLKYL